VAKRFAFRLETVLKVRRLREQQHKRLLAAQVSERRALHRTMQGLNEQIAAGFDKARAQAARPDVDVPGLSGQRFWIAHLQNQSLALEARLSDVEQQLTSHRRDLAGAAKEVRVIENLREKAWNEHRRELQRAEMIEADEMAIGCFRRHDFGWDVG